jgi:sugar/nucleoside kinase (ribokinase family)
MIYVFSQRINLDCGKDRHMKDGIAIAGNLVVDTVKEIDVYPSEGMLSNIGSLQMSVGGCVPNTAIDLKRIDGALNVEALGMVGDDSNGRYLLDMLEQNDVDTCGVKLDSQSVTSFTDVMAVSGGKTRTFFHARGANAVFGFDDINFDSIHSRFFHIGYALLLDGFDKADPKYGTVMAKTLARAQESGLKTSMDVVSEEGDRFSAIVMPSLKYCNNLIINEVEASMICRIPVRREGMLDRQALQDVCGRLMDAGVSEHVVIHAPEAACALTRGGPFVYVPSLRLPSGYIKGSVGAGDAFCAGVLYALYREFDIEEALIIAAGAAASSLSELNSIDGMKSLQEIRTLINQYRV